MPKTFHHTSWANDIVRIDWDLGNKCNLNCSYCPPNTKQGNFSNPDFETVKGFADKMLEHYETLGKRAIITFGTSGEPTIIEWFPNLLKFMHNRVAEIVVQTNLSASQKWWNENGSMIHHVNGTVHYQQGYTLKSLYETIYSISNNSRSSNIVVPMTLEHFDEQIQDIEWIERVLPIKITPLPLLTDLYSGGSWIKYSNQQKEQLKNWHQSTSHIISTHSDESNIFLNRESKKTFDVVFNETDEERCFTGWKCYSGIDTLVIDSRGYVRKGWCAQLSMNQTHMTKWIWDNNTVTCNMAWCRMHHDLQSRKEID